MPRLHSMSRVAAALSAVALTTVGLAACSPGDAAGGNGEGGDTLSPIAVHVYPGALISLPTYVAEEEGIFEKHGIDVEQISIPSAPEAVQALVSGGLDIVNSAPSVILITNEKFEENGAPDRLKAMAASVSPIYYSVVGGSGTDWPNPSDVEAVLDALEGKTVGVTTLGADTQNVLVGLMETFGRDASSIDFVGVGIGQSSQAALEAGQIDALVAAPPSGDRLIDDGIGETIIDFRTGNVHEDFSPWQFTDYYALEGWLDDNAEAATKLREAYDETHEFLLDPANIDRIVEIYLAQSEGQSQESAKSSIERFLPLFTTKISCAGLENVSDFYTTYTDTFKKPIACEDYVWTGAPDILTD